MRDVTCATCGSYVHRYLSLCPGCGAERESTLDAQDPPEGVSFDAEEVIAFASSRGEALLPEEVELLREDPEVYAPLILQSKVGPALRAQVLRLAPVVGPERAKELLSGSAGGGRNEITEEFLPARLRDLKPRYYGGIPAQPAETDVDWAIAGPTLSVVNKESGMGIASIRGDQLVAAMPFSRSDPAGNNWLGIALGNVLTLTQPRVAGGGVTFAWSTAGSISHITLGNRRSLFGKTAPGPWWTLLVTALAEWADAEAVNRETEIGVESYSRELGIHTAAAGPEDGGQLDLASALSTLTELRARGLVSEEEYASKRAEILSRL